MFGASYTDVHASLPVLHFLAIVSLVAAAIFLANIRYRGWRLPAIAIAVMFLTWALAGKAYPAIIQQYKVSPNEITAEIALHRQQHRGHPLRLRTGQGHQRPQPGDRGPHGRRHQGQRGHARERPPLGTAAGPGHLPADPGDPPLLRLQGRRRRPLHRGRQVPPGAHQRPGARPEPSCSRSPRPGSTCISPTPTATGS